MEIKETPEGEKEAYEESEERRQRRTSVRVVKSERKGRTALGSSSVFPGGLLKRWTTTERLREWRHPTARASVHGRVPARHGGADISPPCFSPLLSVLAAPAAATGWVGLGRVTNICCVFGTVQGKISLRTCHPTLPPTLMANSIF